MSTSTESTRLEQADIFIRNEHYNAEKFQIERLSGDFLPMDDYYINLAIVERQGKNINHSERGLMEVDSAPPRVSLFSVFARKKREKPNETIELATIFNERKASNGEQISPRRILIRGCAGAGKSTLCKKIVHDFIPHTDSELHRSWTKLFDRILLVPLRNLKQQSAQTYNLGDLLYDEYFRQSIGGETFTSELWRELNDTNSERTLFILDGLDEVSQLLDPEHKMFHFLTTKLLNQPNVIITSRFSAGFPALQAFDLELETIGFYPPQVKDYIEKIFTNPKTRKFDQEIVNKIQSFLQDHWLLQGVVRTPLQLDAFCYTWENLDQGAIPHTMTEIYNAIVQRLWKKDASQLERHAGNNKTHPVEFERGVETEVMLLECLAFNELFNDLINPTLDHRNEIVKKIQSTLLLDTMLGRSCFVRNPGASPRPEDDNCHFLDRTFQEFFAAQYFVRQWKDHKYLKYTFNVKSDRPINPIELLRRNKYSARYDIFWRFVAGLLDATGQATPFIKLIEEAPLDILGPTHQRLVMHCLSEIRSDLPIRSNLEAKLSQWLLFEYDLTAYSTLALEPEFPENSILTVLKGDWGIRRLAALKALRSRDAPLSDTVTMALVALLQDTGTHVQSHAVHVLEDQLSLRETAVMAVVTLLQDPDKDVRSSATHVLRKLCLPEKAVTALIALLQDTDMDVQYSATTALVGQLNLSDMAVTAITTLLRDTNKDIRHMATKVFMDRSILPNLDTVVMPLITLLQDTDIDVQSSAATALGRQSSLPDVGVTVIGTLLQDTDKNIRHSATKALECQSGLLDTVVIPLIAQLQDTDIDIRLSAAKVLAGQSSLLDTAVEAIAVLLQDKDEDVRSNAARALTGQSSLPDTTVTTLTGLLNDTSRQVRFMAAVALGNQSSLSTTRLIALAALLQSEDGALRSGAARALRGQLSLPDPTVTTLIALLEDEDAQYEASETLRKQTSLSATGITSLTLLVQNKELVVQLRAAHFLEGQSNLPKAVITTLAPLLRDNDWNVRYRAARALEIQLDLPGTAVRALTRLLQDRNMELRLRAASTLGRQSTLSKSGVAILTALLRDKPWDARQKASEALGRSQSRLLLDRILEAGLPLESERLKLLESFYCSLLYCSFSGPLSLYLDHNGEGDDHTRSYILNQSRGLRTVSFPENTQYGQFYKTVSADRQLLNVNNCKLWEDFG